MRYAIRMIAVVSLGVSFGIGLGAVSAHAQRAGSKMGTPKQEDAAQAESRHKEARERENAYRNAMKNIPDGKPNKDPWAGAR
jgi:hypothetical protein